MKTAKFFSFAGEDIPLKSSSLELRIKAKNCLLFTIELENEKEFYDTIYSISKNIQGVADYTLRFCGDIVKVGCINKPPKRVFNPLNSKWYSFEYFKEHLFDFPLTTRLEFHQYLPVEKHRLYGFL